MATHCNIVQAGQQWYVDTPEGRVGPMDSEQEANDYIRLMQVATAAGNETACTDAECLT